MKSVVLASLTIAGLSLLATPRARASDWPCQVALCMANPGGPTQYSACVPPMDRLYQWLSDPAHSFPVCSFVGGENATHYQAVILIPGNGGRPIAGNQAWVMNMPGQQNPNVVLFNGSGYQTISNFNGKVVGFPYGTGMGFHY